MAMKQLLLVTAAMLAMGSSAGGQAAREPYVRVAEIEVDPAQMEAYIAALKEQVETALRLESGVLAHYSVADKEIPAHVTVFEIYADAAAYNEHLKTAHFKNYQTATQDMVKSLKLRETVPVVLAVKRK